MFVFVLVTGIFCYSCDSGAVKLAGCCSAAGQARFESAVPVLCSGLLWADGCADSNYCEVSFDFLTFPVGCWFFCLLIAVSLLLIIYEMVWF